jgi:hypothetical protein
MATSIQGAGNGIRTVNSTSPVKFTLQRKGGAIIHGRLDIWSGVGTPQQRREEVLFFEDSLDLDETFSRKLSPGVYGCIFKVFVVEDLNGTFDWVHLIHEQPMLAAQGDVNTVAATGESQRFRDEYVLRVQ